LKTENRKLKIKLLLPLLPALLLLSILTPTNRTRPQPAFASENKEADANTPPEQKSSKDKTWQIRRRDIRDPNVLASLSTVPRHEFVRRSDSRRAYGDHPIPIGLGQTISQPYIVAYMTEALKLNPDYKVLEIGTGSGYQAAVCAEIVREVYTIEIIEELAKSAGKRLKKLGYGNVFVKAADGYFGWEEKGPFDAIIITAAAGLVPPPLVEQLKPDGRMILPLGSPYGAQTLVLITKDDKGQVHSEGLLPVRFVPMVGRVTEAKRPPKK
jgi:protein-L-isoaspartate(D-aspartate) O-methyltransferase